MLLLETDKVSLLVQACQMYLECEFFITELHALAYFTHKVTLPLLNCIEVCGQTDLLTIFLKLYTDLRAALTNTLKDFSVVQKHLLIKKPDKNWEKK